MAGTESLQYAITISNSGNIDYTYSDEQTLTLQDITNLSNIVIENDSAWNALALSGADYATFILIETDNPVSLVMNSTSNTEIPVETTFQGSFGVSEVTSLYLKNTGTNIARVKYIAAGKLTN